MKELYALKDMLCEELEKYGKKGDLSTGSLEVVQKLASSVNNLCKIIESCEEEEYSNAYNMGGSYERGGNRGGSYTYERGGRGSYARKRDSMGRYSRMDGYSRHDDMIGELKYLMQNSPDEHTKMEFQKFIDKMEMM